MQSIIGNAWLDWIARGKSLFREYKINNYYVDGYNHETQTCFEYIGCYYHGHHCRLTTSFERNQPIEALDNKTPNELWEKNCDRLNELKSDYNVVVITECELKRQILENNALKNFIKDRKKYYKLRKSCGGGINPIDAFFLRKDQLHNTLRSSL
jgi:hypothetical protein